MEMLKVSHIQKSFGNVEVLTDISFTVEKGKSLAIIGSSGSGKTTLLRCLNFLETPNHGTISVDGNTKNIKSFLKRIFGKTGFVLDWCSRVSTCSPNIPLCRM